MPTTPVQLFRTLSAWWVLAAFYGFVFLITAGAALNPSVPFLGRAACGAIALVVAVVMLRARRAGIEVGHDDVVVRRYDGRTTRVGWAKVDSFRLVPFGFKSGVFVAVVLTDGRVLKTQGLVAGSPRAAKRKALIEKLESRRPR